MIEMIPHPSFDLNNMSDEYANSGSKGSFFTSSVNDSMSARERESYPPTSDYATKNYPPPGDSMSGLRTIRSM
ncbi:hypothetical protein B0F90DRAFT_1762487 [Multifurca ochricompacta]|uniref:Uncharacterized protein n=1 Tax=Multifurca ochricompacta TaxID=376703 RepID=A0AAD4QIX3_9AGAM|nr:hypothetical protein B0F90DRAFT_1762487 [Multifurca ochricompacta]